MSEAKHTPGPWKANHFLVVAPGDYRDRVYDGSPIAHTGICGGSLPPDEREANARLIAAAPDLLAACETALKCLIDLAPYPPEVTEGVVGITAVVHAAIQKARGTP